MSLTRTLLFLYMTVGQLFYAYPSRRGFGAPGFNAALHLSVVLGTALQLLTVSLPALRTLLGLELPAPSSLLWVATAVLLSWALAELYVRLPLKPSGWGTRQERSI